MKALKIAIVEDDLIIARSINEMLQEMGYGTAEPARRYSEAIGLVEEEAPDLLLLDIRIAGKMDGIEVAATIRRSFGIPFIFLTANSDLATIQRAKLQGPAAFLTKPVTREQLFAAIEMAVASHTGNATSNNGPQPPANAAPGLFVKDGASFRRIFYAEIVLAESRDNYLLLVTAAGEEVLVRHTLAGFMQEAAGFIQVHRSFAVAQNRIAKILPDALIAAGRQVPVSKTYRGPLMQALGIRQ